MPSKTKVTVGITGLLLLAALSLQGEPLGIPYAHAAEVSDTQGSIVQGILMLTGVLNGVAFLSLKFLSYLSDPATIFGINDSSGILLRMWQISRDIMNILFAIMLLAGAVLTIVFGKQDIVKQHITKFILAVILVNFSWFFPRVIIDVANITTATIYSLPSTVGTAPISGKTAPGLTLPCVWRDGEGRAQPCVVVTDVVFKGETVATCPTGSAAPKDLVVLTVCYAPYDPNANTAFGIINGLVVNHSRLMQLGVVHGAPPTGAAGGSVRDMLYFGFVLIIITFLHIMLVFPIIALTAIMLVRIPILWLTVSFMPFMFIGFIIGDRFIRVNSVTIFTKHFLTAAFLPALVAIPFSIGFIMLNTFAAINPAAPVGLDGTFSIIPEVHSWWDMIWILVSFAVIWVGSRWAMKSDDIYAKVSDPIMNMGSSFMKMPLNIPFIPHDTNNDKNIDEKDRPMSMADALGNAQSTGSFTGTPNPFSKPPAAGPGINPAPGGVDAAAQDFNKNLAVLADAQITEQRRLEEALRGFTSVIERNTGVQKNLQVAMDAVKKKNNDESLGLDSTKLKTIEDRLKANGYR